MESDQQEMIFKLQMFEQQMQQIQQQLQAVEGGIVEMSGLKLDLEEIKESKEKEILASVGRGIFVKAKITSEDLLVDIGDKNIVKKSVTETQEIIGKQIKKLEDVKEELYKNMEELQKEFSKLIEDAENSEKSN